jgi:hypothetical protein
MKLRALNRLWNPMKVLESQVKTMMILECNYV